MNTPHTPGPWLDWETLEWLVDPKHLLSNTEDARLIAAAPDLLDALKSIQRHGELANIDKGGPHWSGGKKPPTMDAWAFPRHLLTNIEAAIAKAEGRS